MPRIDPLQLLKCLSVLLSPEGGILSRDEVPRLVNLMTKFSKKLVSKCVYVLILKNTETSLVDMFMAEGGWSLVQSWLQDAAQSGNWDLVKEILGLLLITPVDVERLKMNCLPKLIKNLSRREDLVDVAQLSNQIVQNWLIIVKGTAHASVATIPPIQSQPENREVSKTAPAVSKEIEASGMRAENSSVSAKEQNEISKDSKSENNQAINTNTFYKVAVKDGKQVIRKLSVEIDKVDQLSNMSDEESGNSTDNKDDRDADKDVKSSEKDKEKSPKSSRSKSSSSSRERDREKDKKKSSSHSSSSRKKSSSSSRDKDKDKRDKDRERDRKDRDKDKDRSKSSSSKSSSKSSSSKDKKDSKDKNKSSDVKDSKDPKETKEKQAEKDKDTLEKLKPQTLDKLGRIPKKSNGTDDKQKENKNENKSVENPDKKKPSFSILNRKATGEERSKTVKVFNAKMRSTGLEEEVKPPPPRTGKKPTPSVQLPTIPPKRPSPPRDSSNSMPPEKKLKIDIPERPGAIKLIPPKPKPAVLQESDMFMDALTASAPKKETKKRKRRLSVTKEAPNSPSSSPVRGDVHTPISPTSPTTALGLKTIAPINFYQDTLSEESEKVDNKDDITTDESKETTENSNMSPENNSTPASPPTAIDAHAAVEDEDAPGPPKQIRLDGLKGVLLYAKKKGPKKSIQWKAEEELVEIKYFELDETERVNVTKTFMDMAKMEVSSEREALIMSRKVSNEDVMEPQTAWRMLYTCEQPEPLAVPGSKSLEKDIQFAREKSVLPALYFDKRRIPDSPEEPIPENHQMSDPVIIPLEDPESQEIDLRSTPWPEPKGQAPQVEPQPMPPMYPNMPFNPNFNNMGAMGNMPPVAPFGGVPPRFPGPPGPHGPMPPVPGNFGPPNMMHNNMMGPPMNPPEMMSPGPMNPGVYGPGPEGFMVPGNEPNYPMQQFNGPPGPNMNMYPPNNFNHRGGGGGRGGGGYRRGGSGGWVQLNGPRNWKRGGGGGPRGGRMCKNIQNHGYCRNGDNCHFVH